MRTLAGLVGLGALAAVCACGHAALPVPSAAGAPTSISPPTAARNGTIVQPPPPVTAADFPLEPAGQGPVDGDGNIPNPATPTGSPVAAPTSCTVSFSSAAGATSGTVNAWLAANQNGITATTVVCLSGTFSSPIHVWDKTSTALLELAPAPGSTATLDLGQVQAADINPNQYYSDAGGVSLVDSRSVEVYGLTVENYATDGTTYSPAGIYVTARSDTSTTNQQQIPHLSACFLNGGACSDIYLIDNTVRHIVNSADENHKLRSVCDNSNVDGYGIAVIAAGSSSSPALQHVVVEDNTVTGTRTGESETVTFNGDITDFLASGNTIDDADNIGLDTIGWETGTSQANHGYIVGNTVYNVDTYSNAAYGRWTGSTCAALPENAAGLYDDGGSYIWFDHNEVWNSDQGINLDVETANRETDHLLVSSNDVYDDPGTSRADPSDGTNPPGTPGTSTVAGHDPYALYVDAFGSGATITDVYVHDNTFQNQSQYYLTPSDGMPVVDLGGIWENVQLWHNTISGKGSTDRYNPLLEIDQQPVAGSTVTIDCSDYGNLTTASDSVNGNFALPDNDWLSLSAWQSGNGHGWDAHSAVGAFASQCPASTP